MSVGLALEAATCFGTTGIAMWELNTLEANARKRPNSIIAFALVLAWGGIALWALSLGLLTVKGIDPSGLLALCGVTFVVAIVTWSAKNVGLLDPAIRKFKNEGHAKTSVNFIAITPITDPDYVKIRRAEYSDIIDEVEDQAVGFPVRNAQGDSLFIDNNTVRPKRD